MQSVAVTDGTIVEAIQDVLRRNFGRTEAEAIDYHVDSRIVLTDPEEFTRLLLRIFGAGTGYLLGAIIRGLEERFGVDVHDGATLGDVMEALKSKPAA